MYIGHLKVKSCLLVLASLLWAYYFPPKKSPNKAAAAWPVVAKVLIVP